MNIGNIILVFCVINFKSSIIGMQVLWPVNLVGQA